MLNKIHDATEKPRPAAHRRHSVVVVNAVFLYGDVERRLYLCY